MSGPLQRVLATLREYGHEPRKAGAGWRCRCPAHDDWDPSLSIRAGDDGRALVHCHAGCSVDAVCQAIGLRPADLFNPDPGRRNGHAPRTRPSVTVATTPRTPARDAGSDDGDAQTFPTARAAVAELERRHGRRSARWTYTNAAGDPVGLVVRWDTPTGKVVRPVSRKADGSGWIIGGMPTPRPLYRLPDLLATKPGARVYVTEGEKAADAAWALGLVATTSPHGSKAASTADWSPVAGRDVVILPDRDDAGERYAADVVRLATAAGARSVRVVRLVDLWADMPPGGDLADYVARRRGEASAEASADATIRAEVEALVERTPATTPTPAPIDGAPAIVRLSDVRPEPVSWVWPERIALGKLTLVVGDPGLGKSLLTLDLAARVSTGAGWPDRPGARCEPGGVVLLSAEDDLADTIRPRLDAAGADCSKIVALCGVPRVNERGVVVARPFDLSCDLPALEEAVCVVGDCRLVVIDPLPAYLGSVDSHKNAEIRGLLAPLADLAARLRVAVVAVTHLNKLGGGPAIYRAMGSLAFIAAARSAWAVAKDRDDPGRRLFVSIKNNLSRGTKGLAFRIGDGPCVEWINGSVLISADEALAASSGGSGEDRSVVDDAAEWLRDYLLAAGPRPATEVEREARAAGFSLQAVRRAKAAIGVETVRCGFGGAGGWVWQLGAQR